MSKKSNSKKIKESIHKLDYPSAKQIKIKFIEGNIDYLKSNNDNLLFKTYLLSHLIHKNLSIGYAGDLDFLNSKLKFQIIDKMINSEVNIDNTNDNFIANQNTEIIIDNADNKVDNLIKDMEQKLNLEEDTPQNLEELNDKDKQLLKKIIEEKIGKNKINELIEYKPINLEDLFKNIVSLIDFHIIRKDLTKNNNSNSSLLYNPFELFFLIFNY